MSKDKTFEQKLIERLEKKKQLKRQLIESGIVPDPAIPTKNNTPHIKTWLAEQAGEFIEKTGPEGDLTKGIKETAVGTEDDIGIVDSIKAGYQNSVTGLIARDRLPDIE